MGVLVFNTMIAKAGNPYQDTLRKIIKTSSDYKVKVDALNDWAWELKDNSQDSAKLLATKAFQLSSENHYNTGFGDYYDFLNALVYYDDPDSGMQYLRKALPYYVLAKDSAKIATCHLNMGNVFILLIEYDSAMLYAHQALQEMLHIKLPPSKVLWCYKLIAESNQYQSNYDSSLYYFHLSMDLAEKAKDTGTYANCLIGIGNVYCSQEDYNTSATFMQRAGTIHYNRKDYVSYILCLSNAAKQLSHAQRYAEAIKMADSSMTQAKKYGVMHSVPQDYQTKGEVAANQKRYDEALKWYLTGLKYSVEYNNKYIHYQLLNDVGNTYVELHQPQKAKEYFLMELKENDGDKESEMECYLSLSDAYRDMNDPIQELAYFKKYSLLKDTLYNTEKTNAIAKLNVQYATKQNQEEITNLTKANAAQQMIANEQRRLRNLLIVLFSVVIVFIGVTWYWVMQRKKKEQENALLNERLHFSRDLHDDLGATLSSISILSEAAKQKLKHSKNDEALDLLTRISDDSREMVTNIGDIVWMINAQNDGMDKLVAHIHNYAKYTLGAKNIDLLFNAQEGVEKLILSIDSRKNIYLIIKEAINNIAKYSYSDNAVITFVLEQNQLRISIDDNGKGFNNSQPFGGNGIKNMQQRAKEIKASFTLKTSEGNGTKVVVQLTLP